MPGDLKLRVGRNGVESMTSLTGFCVFCQGLGRYMDKAAKKKKK